MIDSRLTLEKHRALTERVMRIKATIDFCDPIRDFDVISNLSDELDSIVEFLLECVGSNAESKNKNNPKR